MSRFIEALKRLYSNGSIDEARLDALKDEGKITQEEYDYIVSS